MFNMRRWLSGAVSGTAILCASAGAALADGNAPANTGAWVAIAIIVGFIVLVVLFISGALSVSRRSKSDDASGFGVLEDIDEDEKPKRRK